VSHGIILTQLGCLNSRAGIHLIDHPGTGRSVNLRLQLEDAHERAMGSA
jgi:hypothetical protein